ncbi:DUF1254 domain-containing protein [Consotaella aegiceratis]|uniref:DUF1254 domain-containing protein n=1 Tax=Consotaella aegiceratis TaxID=3097961 RepID=UPI002F41E8FD
MGRLLFACLVGLVGAAIVHIAVIFAIPRVAQNDGWGRLSQLGDLYEVVQIDGVTGGPSGIANPPQRLDFLDPAFAVASCRFSIEDGPVHLFAGEHTDFWSASIYDRRSNNLYSINDRSSVGGVFDLVVGTADQLLDMRTNAVDRDETAIPVEVDLKEGYLILRALIDHESERADVGTFVRSTRCEPLKSSATTSGADDVTS